jgi:hypothetical protein
LQLVLLRGVAAGLPTWPYLFPHDLNILLSLFDHLDSLVPLLLELLLRLAYLLLFQTHPALQLVLSLGVGTGTQLLLLEHFLDVAPLFVLAVVQCFLSHLDEVHEFVVLNDTFESVSCELLERVSLKKALARLALACVGVIAL